MHKFYLTIYILFITQLSQAQKTIPLYEHGIPGTKADLPDKEQNRPIIIDQRTLAFILDVSRPTMTIFLPAQCNGTAVIICPGGGYSGVAMDHEGFDIARTFNESGIAAFVLKYRMPDDEYFDNKSIVPLQDVQRAMAIINEHASEWHVNPRKIGVLGSSAGGHLAACAATKYNQSYLDSQTTIDLKPAFAILNYPVITFTDEYCHKGSRWRLIGTPGTNENDAVEQSMIDAYSCEKLVDDQTPPIFITHAMDDDVVPIENALLFIAACQQHSVKVQSFIYQKGGHGYGMDNPKEKKDWMPEAIAFIKGLFK